MKAAEILALSYWYDGLADWVILSSGAELPINTPMSIAINSKNSGDETFSLRTYLKITDPVGGVLTATPDVYHVPLSPNEETWIYFDNVTFASLGVYTLLIEDKEYDEDAVLDSSSITINGETSPTVPPTPPGEILSSVMPLIMMMMVMMMMMPMFKGMSKGFE